MVVLGAVRDDADAERGDHLACEVPGRVNHHVPCKKINRSHTHRQRRTPPTMTQMPYCKKINRSHTHTHRQRTTPPTPVKRHASTSSVCKNINRSHTHTHTDREQHPRHRHKCHIVKRSTGHTHTHTHTPTENNTPDTCEAAREHVSCV